LIAQAASEMFEEGSVDDRDSFLHAVRDILSSYSSKKDSLAIFIVIVFHKLELFNHSFIFCRFSGNDSNICFIVWYDRADIRAAI
jgi:hypothetical protein